MMNKLFFESAYGQAQQSVADGGFPAGAIIVKDDKIISRGVSTGFKHNDPTKHGEVDAIRKACDALGTLDLSGATIYTTLEPCLMCFSAIVWSEISEIVYGVAKTPEMVKKGYYEGTTSIADVNQTNTHKIKITQVTDYNDEIESIIKKFK